MQKAKHNTVGTDTHPQDRYRHSSKARALSQHAYAILQVLPYFFDESHPVSISAVFFDLFDAAKASQRGVAGFLCRHSSSNVLPDFILQMELEFLGKLILKLSFSKERL